jgi:hypothetical protein
MGQIADTLRATLRDLAQSDARLYRGLQHELADGTPSAKVQPPLLAGEDPVSREELEGLSIKVLWGLCKERGIKGLSSGPKERQVEALLNHPDGPPLRSALPTKAPKGSKGSGGKVAGTLTASRNAGALHLQHLEQRLDRLEQLVVLIAEQVGVPPQAIEQLLPPAGLPPA